MGKKPRTMEVLTTGGYFELDRFGSHQRAEYLIRDNQGRFVRSVYVDSLEKTFDRWGIKFTREKMGNSTIYRVANPQHSNKE